MKRHIGKHPAHKRYDIFYFDGEIFYLIVCMNGFFKNQFTRFDLCISGKHIAEAVCRFSDIAAKEENGIYYKVREKQCDDYRNVEKNHRNRKDKNFRLKIRPV